MIAVYCPRCRTLQQFDPAHVTCYTTTSGKAWWQARCPDCRTILTTTKLDITEPSSH